MNRSNKIRGNNRSPLPPFEAPPLPLRPSTKPPFTKGHGPSWDFLNQLARDKVCHEPSILRRRVQLAWRMRWQAILSCSDANAFAASLLELRGLGADGDLSYEVESTNTSQQAQTTETICLRSPPLGTTLGMFFPCACVPPPKPAHQWYFHQP